MTQNLRVRIFGRPVKPVAIALMLSMIVIGWAAYEDLGILDGSKWADVLAIFALSVCLLFTYAFVANSQRVAEWGLVGAFFVWGIRFWLIMILSDDPLRAEGLWLSGAWMVVAGGSFLLERTDDQRHYSDGPTLT